MKYFCFSLLTLLFSLFTLCIFSQSPPAIEWQNTIGGSDSDYLYSIHQTSDGGYIAGGYSQSGISGDKTEPNRGIPMSSDYWVIKLKASGDIEWQKTIGGDLDDVLYDVEQTSDEGYILGGYSLSGVSGDKTSPCFGVSDYWLVKLDKFGNIIWQKTIGSVGQDVLTTVKQTPEGGYFIGGRSDGNISGNKTEPCLGDVDYWVLKLDALGNIEWQNTIGGNKEDYLYSAERTTDGGYILGGTSKSEISGDKTEAIIGIGDFWIVKLNAEGLITGQNTIGANTKDGLCSVHEIPGVGYITGGYSSGTIYGDKTEKSKFNDYWIMKLTNTGEIIWQNTISGIDTDMLYSIESTFDGGYILGGYSNSPALLDKTEACDGLYDYWLVKVDALGNIQWNKTFGGSGEDYLFSVQRTNDNGYILAGYSASSVSADKTEGSMGGYDFWIIKLFPDGEESCSASPGGLHTGALNPTSAKLFWDADPSALKYKIQYHSSSSFTWIDLNAATNTKKLTGLLPSTTYKYRVRSQCAELSLSPWSGIESFTTSPLKEMNNEQSVMNIYPNPSNGYFTIQFPDLGNDEDIFISIKNMLGEEIYAEQLNVSELNHTIYLNQNISGGMYVVEMQTADKNYERQIVIE